MLASLVAALMVGTLGCDEEIEDPEKEEEGPFDYVEHDPYQLVPFQDGVDREMGFAGIVDDRRPAEDEVRVGRIEGEETGFFGVWSHCRPGDFLLTNSEIEVCIQEESTNRFETYSGGMLVDARRHDQPDGEEDVLDMVIPLLIDLSTASAEKVEVVRDGSDGDVAVLRVTGTDIELGHLTGVLGTRLRSSMGATVETEYRLEPGSDAVEMVTQLTVDREQPFHWHVGDWFAYGDRARAWSPGHGFGVYSGEQPWLAGVGDGHSFALVFEDGASPMGVGEQFAIPFAEMRADRIQFNDEDPGAYRRWFVVGDGTLDSVRKAAAEVRGDELSGEPVSLNVQDEGGAPVEGAQVLVTRDGEAITFGHSDAQGSLELVLESGSYEAQISEFGGPKEVEVSFEVGSGEVDLTVPQLATISLEVSEDVSAEWIPARVSFQHSQWGSWFDYAADGSLEVKVPAGQIDITVTRGFEYDLYQESLDLDVGEERELDIVLVRSLDTEGWRSGDFHQHMEPSLDSRISVRQRVLENATQGVDLAVSTDHDVVTDLRPAIEDLGLQDHLSSFPGVEISPLYAHYNLYPVEYRPEKRGRGSIELALMDDGEVKKRRMPEIISMARAFESDPVVQMNHPRNNSGMMNHVRFDPEDFSTDGNEDDFASDIDAIEVINRYGHVCMVLADWSGLINAGHRVTGLGNSDTHGADGEAGVPRNYMVMDRDPGDIDAEPVREAIRNQRVSVASQAFIDFTDGTLPGDEVEVGPDGLVEFDIRVQTPDWAEALSLFVIVNGEVVEAMGRSEEDGPYDFEETIELEIEEDSWVIFWTDGPRPNAPVPVTRQVIGFTNPVYLKTGGGEWQPPGVRPLDLEQIDTGYCD